MAEWFKALVLGTSLCGGVGSNPTPVIDFFAWRLMNGYHCQSTGAVEGNWVLSSVVEHRIADPVVAGSIPAAPSIRHGVVGNISACHADARGSIPRAGVHAPLV